MQNQLRIGESLTEGGQSLSLYLGMNYNVQANGSAMMVTHSTQKETEFEQRKMMRHLVLQKLSNFSIPNTSFLLHHQTPIIKFMKQAHVELVISADLKAWGIGNVLEVVVF